MPPLEGHTDRVTSVAFSPDGRHIVSGSWDETIRVWDASTGHAAMPPLEGHTSPVNSVAFSPDGSHIASGSADKAIRVWDASTGHVTIIPPEGHDETITSVAGSRDGYPSSAAPSIFSSNDGEDAVLASKDITTSSRSISDHSSTLVQALTSSCPSCRSEGSSSTECLFNIGSLLRKHPDYDGWCRGPNHELLMWILPEYRKCVFFAPCALIIPKARVTVYTSRAAHGLNLTNFYTPNAAPTDGHFS
ncbi:hypothetical protein HGRIS_001602 [Hohenbuehelia grisea]|uniref:WD40 repeat-like protein n=1 Tax=Hohenbuehelia grisea TaxID=104357 RepID=A0ABR3JHW2_9AGAR